MTSVDWSFTCVLATVRFHSVANSVVVWRHRLEYLCCTFAKVVKRKTAAAASCSDKKKNTNECYWGHVTSNTWLWRENVSHLQRYIVQPSVALQWGRCNVLHEWVTVTGSVAGTPTVNYSPTSYLQLSGTHRGASPCRCRGEVCSPAESCPRLAWAPSGRGRGSWRKRTEWRVLPPQSNADLSSSASALPLYFHRV